MLASRSLRPRLDHVRLLYVHELRSALRERHIVVNSILVPIVLFPLTLWAVFSGMAFVRGRTDQMASRVAVEDLPWTTRCCGACWRAIPT